VLVQAIEEGSKTDIRRTFRIDIEAEHPAHIGQRGVLHNVLVDTGAELSWIPAAVLDALGVERKKT
jgi:hypothetical protein